ncbi:MAG: CpaF family protein [Candidatus Helarchaeota archaeon]|nr:CpaF family protein [Candidatus Helarchaeota archaeon]
MKELSNICKPVLELVYGDDGLTSNRLFKRLNFLCSQNESCKNRKIFSNSICTYNCFRMISDFDKIDEIFFINEQFRLCFYKNQTKMLKELSDFIRKIKLISLKLNLFNKSCVNRKVCQNKYQIFLNRLFGNYNEIGLLQSNPIRAYVEIKNEIMVINSLIERNKNCKKCLNHILEDLRKIELSINQLDFFKKYMNLTPTGKKEPFEKIYLKVFQFKIIQNEETITESFQTNQIIDQYSVGPYIIKIYNDYKKEEFIYSYSNSIKSNQFTRNLLDTNETFNDKMKFFTLNELIRYKLQKIKNFLESNHKGSKVNSERLSKILCFESIGLKKIIPFLLDDFIEEIFLDNPKSTIYIDHSKYGRCFTPITFNSNDIENFKTKIRLENNSLLDEKHPFLKTDLTTDFFNVRVSCNISPLATDEFNFSIRKLRKNVFSIIELINLNTISIEAAAYLCFLLFHRRNILVIGAPGAGKTTLINSLDILTPNEWRKIYLEDVIESIAQYKYGKHQVRFHVSSNSQENKFFSKNIQVRESLHRTPDMIFIGELIYKETVKAYFFLLKTGLRCGLGTCHGESPELIIQRWIGDDEIPQNSIKNLDVIVQIAKTKSGRKVIRIAEIGINEQNNDNIEIVNLFLRDPENDLLKNNFNSLKELFDESPVMKKIKELLIENISVNNFVEELMTYYKFFELLKNQEIYELDDIISFIKKFWVFKRNLEMQPEFSFKKLNSQLLSLFL